MRPPTHTDLPVRPDAEKSLLSCLLRRPSILQDETVRASAVLFHFDAHRRIAKAMIDLFYDGRDLDPGVIADHLREPALREYLVELYDVVASPANAGHYATILREVAEARRAVMDAQRLLRAAKDGSVEDIARIRAEIAGRDVAEVEEIFVPLNIRMCVSATPPPQEFIVGHLPDEHGIFGMLIGPDGARKSWLALHIALAVAGGRPVAQAANGKALWPPPKSGKGLYLILEDSAPVLWRRIWSIGQVPGYGWIGDAADNLRILPVPSCDLVAVDSGGIPTPTLNVNRLIREGKGSRLIIIDPLAEVLDASENDDRAAKCLIQTLRRISRETGAAVLGVHHQNKVGMMNGEKHAQSSRGSSKIPAGSRWTIVLQPGEDPDWTCITEGKASYARKSPEKWLRVFRIDDGTGKEIASVPVASGPPEEKPVFADRTGRLKCSEERRENETSYY